MQEDSPTRAAARTVVFCTAFVYNNADPYYRWDVRYRIWVESILRSKLDFDQVILIDDGSAVLPDWPDVRILREGDDLRCDDRIVLYHFNERLGRRAISDFPGWVRSFFFASRYAAANKFDKIVHIEADAFLITDKAVACVNGHSDGWTALWCPRFNRPESGIQIISGAGMTLFSYWAEMPVESFAGLVIEKTLPFTSIERRVSGDRYGEGDIHYIPRNADWCMQAKPPDGVDPGSYFWWLPWFRDVFPGLSMGKATIQAMEIGHALSHGAPYYLDWLTQAEQILRPLTYFEIGTHAGDSVKRISCDAVCVDPHFMIQSNVINRRRSMSFFQGTSDAFFAETELVGRLLHSKIDLAFLDGLHLYEALLSDFIQTEPYMNRGGMVLLHDCLPLNTRMAERDRRRGLEDEPEVIRDFWTGDVWKVVVILEKYRPDLKVTFVNCGPTGLVAITGFDADPGAPSVALDDAVSEYRDLTLEAFGLERLWRLRPMFAASQITSDHASFFETLFR